MKNKIIWLVGIFIFFPIIMNAQVDSSWIKMQEQMKKEFTDYQQKVENQYNKFVDANDKQFTDFLKKSWKEVQLYKGVEKKDKPKPKIKPVIKKVEKKEEKPIVVIISPKKKEKPIIKENTNPITPGIQKKEPKNALFNTATFTFYGTNINIEYDPNMRQSYLGDAKPEKIANFWEAESKTNHYRTVNDLLDMKNYLQLPDWGYLKLVESFSKSISPDKNSATMLAWFLMNKSRYKVKLAYSRIQMYLLIPSEDLIFRTRYYTFDNIKYYLFDNNAPKVYTYTGNYPDAKMLLNMHISASPVFHVNSISKQYNFEYDDRPYQYNITINRNLVDFYKDYPPCDVSVNFQTPLSKTLFNSIQQNIKPLIAGKSKLDAANILLRLVQKSFQYKTDQEQFGVEKYFYPEEVFYYPASDCEDRAVLYTNLVQNLLNLPAIGLKYPGHMSSAIYMPEKQNGDQVIFKGKRFVISDGTYENAPVGMCMSQFRNTTPQIIELLPLENTKTNILAKISNQNPNLSIEKTVYDNAGNTILVGSFRGKINLNNQSYQTNGKNTIVIKLNKQNVLWVRQLKSSGSNYPKLVAYKNNNLFINGAFSGTINTGNSTVTTQSDDHFIAKINSSGNIEWINKLHLDDSNRVGDFIYAAKFDNLGNRTAIMYYDSKDYFQNYGFKTFADGSGAISNNFYGNPGNSYAKASNVDFISLFNQHLNNVNASADKIAFKQLASFFYALRDYNKALGGNALSSKLSQQEPEFGRNLPKLSKELKAWTSINKEADRISISKKYITYLNDIELLKDFDMKVNAMNSGNMKITTPLGVWISVNDLKFKVNYMILEASSGNLIVNYSSNRYRKTYKISDF